MPQAAALCLRRPHYASGGRTTPQAAALCLRRPHYASGGRTMPQAAALKGRVTPDSRMTENKRSFDRSSMGPEEWW
jgi:hypothetical protein